MKIRALVRFISSGVVAKFRVRHNRLLAELRKDWGREIARERDMDVIATYHVSVAGNQKVVDGQTWQDLGMDDLFAKIDRTAGMPGSQLLYHQMRTYENDDHVLAERARQQTIFMENQALREQCQVLLARLNARGSEWLASTLLNPFPERPRLAPIFYLASFLSLGCLAGTAFFHFLFIPALILMFANFAITAFYSWRITPYFAGLSQIVTMLGVSESLAAIADNHALPQLDCLRKTVPLVVRIRKRLGWLVIDRTALPDLVESGFGYLNMFFLFDILVYLRSLEALREHQAALVGILGAVGSLDSSIAVASYVQSLPCVTRPRLVGDCQLEVSALYNPLLAAPVSNSLVLLDRSALITGPNMAGKTVFIRTVGINVILAQTLSFCLAKRAVIPRAIVRSAIRREDNLAAGQSYFFAEILQILDFIRAEQDGQRYVFFIDEIFRGTNTIERIAASTAVLRHLARHQIVMATTHDVELQKLLADTFDMYHFNDQVVDGRYSFDYRLNAGPAQSRNAIKLLDISGFPKSIILEAETLVARNIPT
jgi:MutS domain V